MRASPAAGAPRASGDIVQIGGDGTCGVAAPQIHLVGIITTCPDECVERVDQGRSLLLDEGSSFASSTPKEDELEKELDAKVPDMRRRLGQPRGEVTSSPGCDAVDGAVWPGIARFGASRARQAVGDEAVERPVGERPADRQNTANLSAACKLSGEGEAVGRAFSEQAEHRPLGQ